MPQLLTGAAVSIDGIFDQAGYLKLFFLHSSVSPSIRLNMSSTAFASRCAVHAPLRMAALLSHLDRKRGKTNIHGPNENDWGSHATLCHSGSVPPKIGASGGCLRWEQQIEDLDLGKEI